MDKSDKQKFAEIMLVLGEMFPGKPPSDEKIELFFMALQDVSLEEIRHNAAVHINTANFFPVPADLRNDGDPEVEAQEAFRIVEDALNKYYDPYLHGITLRIIKDKVGEKLFQMVQRFGTEIYYQDNITATRAQFTKAYKAEKKLTQRGFLNGKPEIKKIGDVAKGLLHGIDKEKQ